MVCVVLGGVIFGLGYLMVRKMMMKKLMVKLIVSVFVVLVIELMIIENVFVVVGLVLCKKDFIDWVVECFGFKKKDVKLVIEVVLVVMVEVFD